MRHEDDKEEKMFTLKGKYKVKGLTYLKKPPDIKGKVDSGIRPSLTFFFENEGEKEEIYRLFSDGMSRIPSGKRLLKFVRKYTDMEYEESSKDMEDALGK